jgi:hydrogenase maturation protease
VSRLVIGIGNLLRGDDGVGPTAATGGASTCDGGLDVIAAWEGFDDVVVIDAMVSGRPVGTVVVFDAVASPLPVGTLSSTHAIGIAEAVEVARRLGRLPERLTVFGIEAGELAPGGEMSPEVVAAAKTVAAEVARA